MEFFLIYLYIVFENLKGEIQLFFILPIIGLLVQAVLLGILHDESNPRDENGCLIPPGTYIANKLHKKTAVTCMVVGLLVLALVPSRSQVAWIVGGGITWNIAQDEEVRKLPGKVAEAANRFLEYTQEETESSE